MNFSEPVFSLRVLGSVDSVGLPLTPVHTQEEMTIDVVGEETLGIPHSCGLLILGKQPACPRATDSMGRFREIYLSRGEDGGELTSGPVSKTQRATETSPLASDTSTKSGSIWVTLLAHPGFPRATVGFPDYHQQLQSHRRHRHEPCLSVGSANQIKPTGSLTHPPSVTHGPQER